MMNIVSISKTDEALGVDDLLDLWLYDDPVVVVPCF